MMEPTESSFPPSGQGDHTKDQTIDALLAEVERELSSQAPGQSNHQPDDPAELLAELQAEFAQKQTPAESDDLDLEGFAQQQRRPAPPDQGDANVANLLAEVQAEFQQRDPVSIPPPERRSPAAPNDDVQALLADLQTEFSQKPAPPIELPTRKTSAATDGVITQMKREFEANRRPPPPDPKLDHLLDDLKGEFKEIDTAAQIKEQEARLREHRQREWERQQRRKAIAQKAAAWLKDLDPYSDEGLWFEEFAYNYPSKQEAAIDYLEALWTQP
jgi:hypothetical protein